MQLNVDALNLDLKNCYGISRFQYEFNIGKEKHVAIYAPNGTMKSSLAQTFKDAGASADAQERVFGRESKLSITDESGAPVRHILVIESQPSYDMADASKSLLVNEELRREYESLTSDLRTKTVHLMKSL